MDKAVRFKAPVEIKFIERLGRMQLNSGAAYEVDVIQNARGFYAVRIAFRRPNGVDFKFIDLNDFGVPMVHSALGQFLETYREEEPG